MVIFGERKGTCGERRERKNADNQCQGLFYLITKSEQAGEGRERWGQDGSGGEQER